MIIFQKAGAISPAQSKTNIKFNFNVPDGIKTLVVRYGYNPKTVEDRAEALGLINKGLSSYGASFIDPETMLPVKNLVTLSFDENGRYRGACHRQANEQTVYITSANSTAGIINREVEAGEWDVVLNVHYVGCDVNYEITVEGEIE